MGEIEVNHVFAGIEKEAVAGGHGFVFDEFACGFVREEEQ